MNVKQFLDQCNEQNWPVAEHVEVKHLNTNNIKGDTMINDVRVMEREKEEEDEEDEEDEEEGEVEDGEAEGEELERQDTNEGEKKQAEVGNKQKKGENRKSSKREERAEGNKFNREKSVLEARVQSLKQAIAHLKTELLEEKALWKKEVELMASLISPAPESEINSEADVEIKSVASVAVSQVDPIMSSPLIKDFEEKLSRYQGALAQAHAEKRLSIRRQIAANTYRKRLYEVEKLCQEELNKVRETATYLEPLKQMASEWSKARSQHHVSENPRTASPLPVAAPVTAAADKPRVGAGSAGVECGGDFVTGRARESPPVPEDRAHPYEVPVKQIDASLVMDEDASSEIKGKIVLQIGSLPSEVPTICYSAKFE